MATALAEKRFATVIAEDDGVREVHGLRLRDQETLRFCEEGEWVRFYAPPSDRYLTARQAHYLANRLHRLARRIERREVSA